MLAETPGQEGRGGLMDEDLMMDYEHVKCEVCVTQQPDMVQLDKTRVISTVAQDGVKFKSKA